MSIFQEDLYELILQTNKESLKLCKPGASIQQIHNYSVAMLRKGLNEIGILKSEASHSYHQLNPTSIGHYLGMDVHDCSTVSYNRPLKPGVVITIEPGIYIPSSFDGPERYQGIGIRIEDEVLITDSGYEVLTASVPKEVKQIESLLNNFSYGMEVLTASVPKEVKQIESLLNNFSYGMEVGMDRRNNTRVASK
ncbi:putative Xaa-Pro aminopeptidase 3 [Morus notabilis]|uniref:Putative Xaa-Pro aminopeptidase 3 n=1 Tax=Morus notabilis TaxID=981085 RepID=W9R5G9_9ROSA|nr:putative Xaa-Pro aminopeptidase 3 [Morus notabilis]